MKKPDKKKTIITIVTIAAIAVILNIPVVSDVIAMNESRHDWKCDRYGENRV